MKSAIINRCISDIQNALIGQVKANPNLVGRLGSVPVALVDVALHTAKPIFHAVESVVNVALNLIGAAFSDYYSIRDAVKSTENVLNGVAATVSRAVASPINLIYQVGSLLLNPTKTNSISSSY